MHDLKEPIAVILQPQVLTAKWKLVVCHKRVSCVHLVKALSRVWCKFSRFSVLNKTARLYSKQVGAGLIRSPGIKK